MGANILEMRDDEITIRMTDNQNDQIDDQESSTLKTKTSESNEEIMQFTTDLVQTINEKRNLISL